MPSSLFFAQFLACSLGPPLARSSGDSRSLFISGKTLMHPEYPGKRNTQTAHRLSDHPTPLSIPARDRGSPSVALDSRVALRK